MPHAPVTWLLPVKNGMPYLRETLASIQAQTYRNFEVSSPGTTESTDSTVQELRRWIPSRLPRASNLDRSAPSREFPGAIEWK